MEGGPHRDTGFLGNQLGLRRVRHDCDPASDIESICKSLPRGFVIAQGHELFVNPACSASQNLAVSAYARLCLADRLVEVGYQPQHCETNVLMLAAALTLL
jgi:hypothetical protein